MPAIALWRELRRLDDEPSTIPDIEAARAPANVDDYAGHVTAVRSSVLAVTKKASDREGRYGDAPPVVVGVWSPNGTCITRRHKWSISGAGGESETPWTRVNNCTRQRDSGADPILPEGAVPVVKPKGTGETGVGSACSPATVVVMAPAAGSAPPPLAMPAAEREVIRSALEEASTLVNHGAAGSAAPAMEHSPCNNPSAT